MGESQSKETVADNALEALAGDGKSGKTLLFGAGKCTANCRGTTASRCGCADNSVAALGQEYICQLFIVRNVVSGVGQLGVLNELNVRVALLQKLPEEGENTVRFPKAIGNFAYGLSVQIRKTTCIRKLVSVAGRTGRDVYF